VGDRRGAYRVLLRKLEGKTTLGTPRRRWENNTRTDLQEIYWDGLEWIDLAQGREEGRRCCEYGEETSCSIKCREFLH
jgi:hypothetical protein